MKKQAYLSFLGYFDEVSQDHTDNWEMSTFRGAKSLHSNVDGVYASIYPNKDNPKIVKIEVCSSEWHEETVTDLGENGFPIGWDCLPEVRS